jgi:hypothetical protein
MMERYEWSKLNHMQLGRCAEYLVKMEFALYGFDVYTAEVAPERAGAARSGACLCVETCLPFRSLDLRRKHTTRSDDRNHSWLGWTHPRPSGRSTS